MNMFCCFHVSLSGDPLSQVTAHVDDGVLTASIDTKEDTYVIEVPLFFL